MKKSKILILSAILMVSLNSCGVGAAYVYNLNANNTEVRLSQKNYEIVDRVTGQSEVDYVLVFGGMKKRQLYANAYSKMMENADLSSGSKAIVNVVTEEHLGGVPPFYYKRTITVSGNVIEFTE